MDPHADGHGFLPGVVSRYNEKSVLWAWPHWFIGSYIDDLVAHSGDAQEHGRHLSGLF